jgi:hypothetical protein
VHHQLLWTLLCLDIGARLCFSKQLRCACCERGAADGSRAIHLAALRTADTDRATVLMLLMLLIMLLHLLLELMLCSMLRRARARSNARGQCPIASGVRRATRARCLARRLLLLMVCNMLLHNLLCSMLYSMLWCRCLMFDRRRRSVRALRARRTIFLRRAPSRILAHSASRRSSSSSNSLHDAAAP